MPTIHSPHIIAFCGWLLGWVMLWRVPRLERVAEDADTGDSPDVTVIIPARNEANRIRPLLESLEEQRAPNVRVIVVDDHSEDDTAKIAGSFDFVEVLPAPPLPKGWFGKPWACHSGAQAARPGVLMFLDADTWLNPGGLEHLLNAWRTHGGLISVYPYATMRRPYERLSIFFQILAMMGVRDCNLFPGERATGAIGTMLVTSKADYELCGGFAAVRADPIEDFGLARCYGENNRSVRVYGGYDDASSRLYPDGFRALCRGWLKTLGAGVRSLPFPLLAGIVVWMVCALGGLKWVHGPFRWESGVLYGLFSIQVWVMGRQIGPYGILSGLAYPLLGLFFVALFVISLFQTFLQRKVVWRGRDLDLSTESTE